MPIVFVALLALVLCQPSPAAGASGPADAGRQVFRLNLGWRYHRGDAGEQASAAAYDDRAWEPAVLPHTYELTSINLDDSEDDATQPTFHRDLSWYRRELSLNVEDEQRVFLEFEGAHQITDLWVNGKHVGQHATGGFTPFHFDITEYVEAQGANTIAIRLDNRTNEDVPPDGFSRDYILFGGLYRDVRLVITDPLHVTFPWEGRDAGVRITVPSVSRRSATVTVATSLRNDSDSLQSCRIVSMIANAEGVVVEKLASEVTILAGREHTCVQTGGVDESVRLWSCDDPYLYRVHTLVERDGEVVDHVVNPLGLRWFEHTTDRGFLLNGEPLELIGANRHQQYPYLGDAVPNNLHRADAIKFKRSGVNVIRLAHYPHDDAFLDSCDELGLLVCEEPPTWIEFGSPLFMDRLEQAQRVTIRNHRNHPCVWGWAGGINHRGTVRRLHYAAKEEDPTRITMSNSTLWTGPAHQGVSDLYSVMDYRGAKVPAGGLLFGMEHSGSLDAIGHQRIVSRYKGDPQRIGLALWSAHDSNSFKKRGEVNPNLSEWKAALWDAFRLSKPAYYWYRSELTAEPMIHIPDERAQKPGTVTVFSNCEQVSLVQNGVTTKRFEPTRTEETKHLTSPPFVVPVEWESEELTAIGYNQGVEAARHTIRKPAKPHHLELTFDMDGFEGIADGSSVVLAYARVCDRSGTTVPEQTPPVTFRVEGPAEIVGDSRIGANPVIWERGVAPVLLRVGTEIGEIKLTAVAEGLLSDEVSLSLDTRRTDQIHNPLPVEPFRLRVDLGGLEQHVEEEWTAWSAESGKASIKVAESRHGEVRVKLIGGSSPIGWRSSWGVPGDLCFMIEDGADSAGELRLVIGGLPTGKYTLRSWHHRVVDRRQDAPPLVFRVTDADGADRLALQGYEPTFGRKIQVAADGGGGAGDGGSDLAAANPAVIDLRAGAGGRVVVRISAENEDAPLTLNGFELVANE